MLSSPPLLPTVDQTVLVFIDVQERLLPVMAEIGPVLQNLRRWLSAAKILDLPLLVTEQYPQGLGSTLPQLKAPAERIAKRSFSCFGEKEFATRVATAKHLILVGLEAHVCVLHTALDALHLGQSVAVAADAVTSRRAADRDSALAALSAAGALVVPTETLLFGLIGSSQHPQFRAISRLVR